MFSFTMYLFYLLFSFLPFLILFPVLALTDGARRVGIDDVKIIFNDWPYGIDKSIVHLCVWTKFPLDVDEKDPVCTFPFFVSPSLVS